MCGIAAFSLTPTSKVNARQLAHALLTQIEKRGSHASGFAAVDTDGETHVYKSDKPGSQLPLALMPRRSTNVILHTRYATQGSPQDNRNNHPVLSTDGKVAVVHNGVISNDDRLRGELGIENRHGQVDSLVIPSLIAQQGVDSLSKLSGYAAIAWLDSREGKMPLHIAKLKNSPVHYTWLYDGSFVMASTETLLRDALESIGLRYGGVFELGDQKMMTVNGGFVFEHEASPRMSYSSSTYARYSGATAGGHGSTGSTGGTGASRSSAPATGKTGPVGSEATKSVALPKGSEAESSESVDIDAYMADLEEWRRNRAAQDEQSRKLAAESIRRETASSMALGMTDELDDEDDEVEAIIAGMEERERQERYAEAMACTMDDNSGEKKATASARFGNTEGYYIVDSDGDMTHHPALEDLEARLRWLSKITKSESDAFEVSDEINWVNHIFDVGSVDEDGQLISWIEDMSDIDEHESPSVRHLNYIREGVGKLISVRGS